MSMKNITLILSFIVVGFIFLCLIVANPAEMIFGIVVGLSVWRILTWAFTDDE